MNKYENIIIGFGKGGKTLAGALAAAGQSVALIERSEQMFGGTCINVACIPTKSLEYHARLHKDLGGDFAAKSARYREAVEAKRALTAKLRGKNYERMVSAGVEVIVGEASFMDANRILVTHGDGDTEQLWGDRIYINTGARPFVPEIPGLQESAFVYTSESLMELDQLPRDLVIIGGGYIGLEFASYYANFGSAVTMLLNGGDFLPREDEEVAQSVLESLEHRGIRILREIQVTAVRDEKDHAVLSVTDASGARELTAQAVLVATGRRPNLEGLKIENAGLTKTGRGAVAVDERLRTEVPHIYAMGDVTGGLQFTYISLDDSRIVKSQLLGDGSRTAKNRGEVPYSVFIDPPFSRVGLTQRQAEEQGYSIKTARMPAAAIPKAQVVEQPDGLLKVIVDQETNQILGAHLFCAESHEMINLIKMAMDAGLPYTVLQNAIYTHPTMSEAFNDLFAGIR